MKKFAAIALAIVLVLSLAACGGKKETAEDTPAEIKGEVVDSTAFKAICPEGWLNIPQSDVFGEKDENGNYPINPDMVQFCKGGETEFDIFDHVTIIITLCNESATAEQQVETLAYFYDPFEETKYTINGTEVIGAEAEMALSEGDDPYKYQFAYVEADGRLFQISVLYSLPDTGDLGARITDADIQAIIGSIELD